MHSEEVTSVVMRHDFGLFAGVPDVPDDHLDFDDHCNVEDRRRQRPLGGWSDAPADDVWSAPPQPATPRYRIVSEDGIHVVRTTA